MKYLHTMLRVTDLDRSLKFYTEVLGLKLIRKTDYPDGEFTLAFLGPDADSECLELTYNWGKKSYELGDAYGHVAFGVPDIYATCEALAASGAKITRPPGPMKHGKTIIAFVEDPDAYKIELIQR